MGQVLVAQMRSSEAMAHYEHAMAIRRATNAPVGQTAQTAFALAKILWENEPERARRLAEEARDGYRSAGQAHERSLRSVERWLAQHRV
jgi:hypothetical protein